MHICINHTTDPRTARPNDPPTNRPTDQVYVCKEKAQTLAACNLAPEYASLLTTNHLETNLHAVGPASGRRLLDGAGGSWG